MISTDERAASVAPATGTGLLVRHPAVAMLAFPALIGLLACLPPARGNDTLVATLLGAAGGLSIWTLLERVCRTRRGQAFGIVLAAPVKAHYVQACMQLCIYAYWGWYWPEVYRQTPLILAQLVFLYAFDGLLSWSRGRPWRIGFGPFPVVLSTNLFLWFRDDWFYLQFAMVAACALGKEFLRWKRDGKSTHIFNPSAFGLALFSVVLIASGRTAEITWGVEVASTLAFPPYIYVLIFGVGLVVQYLFAVTLMTLSAVAALVLFEPLVHGHHRRLPVRRHEHPGGGLPRAAPADDRPGHLAAHERRPHALRSALRRRDLRALQRAARSCMLRSSTTSC